MLLSIDPAFAKTGWAVFSGPRQLVDFGLIKTGVKHGDAVERCFRQCRDIMHMLDEHSITEAVVEIPTGHAWGPGNGRGQSLYGMAAGAIVTILWGRRIKLHRYTTHEWTKSVKKKPRADKLTLLYPDWCPEIDKGLDIADAIGIAEYHFGVQPP